MYWDSLSYVEICQFGINGKLCKVLFRNISIVINNLTDSFHIKLNLDNMYLVTSSINVSLFYQQIMMIFEHDIITAEFQKINFIMLGSSQDIVLSKSIAPVSYVSSIFTWYIL